ncbi:MAG: type II CAAX endopeptidase family protein [Acholeplasma sp.]|nr:type II CAAX endopeptidase family protein [Acholeplasma sp.]
MKNEQDNEIIDFDELFEKETKKESSKAEPISKPKAVGLIGVYFLITLIVALVLQLSMLGLNVGTVSLNVEQAMLENVSQHTYGIGYLPQSDFDLYESDYPNIKVIYESDAYVVFANKGNTFLLETYEVSHITSIYEEKTPNWPIKDGYRPEIKRFLFEGDTTFLTAFEISLPGDSALYYPKTTETFSSNAQAILNFVVYVLLAIALIPLTLSTLKNEFKMHFPRKTWAIDLLIGYGIMLLVSMFANVIVSIISSIFKYLPEQAVNQQAIETSLFSQYGILILLVTVLFAPIIEELIFRKSMFSLIRNPKVAIVVSSLLFGLIHVASEASVLGFVTNWIAYSASGFALGYIYIKNNHNVWSSIMIHALYNSVAVLLMLFVL